jgi:hypothetical protein
MVLEVMVVAELLLTKTVTVSIFDNEQPEFGEK